MLFEEMNKTINNSIFKDAIKGGYTKKYSYKTAEKNSLVFYSSDNKQWTLNNFEDAPSAYINFMSILVSLFKQIIKAAKKIKNACKELLDMFFDSSSNDQEAS